MNGIESEIRACVQLSGLLEHFRRNPRKGDNADVIFLAEALDDIGDLSRRPALFYEFLNSGETEEFAVYVHGFGQAVGSEHHPIAWLKYKSGNLELGVIEDAQRKSALDRHGFAVHIGRHVARIGQRDCTLGGDRHGHTGGMGIVAAQQPAI